MKWSILPFQTLYECIQENQIDDELFKEVLLDLKGLNLDSKFTKNEHSRKELEKGQIKLSDGDEFKLNEKFIISVIQISDELNLDELVVAELILENSDNGSTIDKDISLSNHAKVKYYWRRQYILQIVSYILNCHDPKDRFFKNLVDDGELINNILPSFISIHRQLNDIKQLVNKTQILGNVDILFHQTVRFKKDFLLKEYDILSQILFGLFKSNVMSTKTHIDSIICHISSMDTDDFFIVYYIPSLILAFSNLSYFSEKDVIDMHTSFFKELDDDNIYRKPIKVACIFIFLTFFISWCKESLQTRAKLFDFETKVDRPLTTAIELGAVEQLMVLVADTSLIEQDKSMELFYDIRSLLQRHIPKLLPKQLIDSGYTLPTDKDKKLNSSTDPFRYYECSQIKLSDQTMSQFLSTFHDFLQTFISDCAFLLTKIKNAEEDSLLSGEDLYLDDICAKADLERFFLIIYYFYSNRPYYSQCFWQDSESTLYGFIEWASKCDDTLMKSCFYLMLSSLSYSEDNALHIYCYINSNHHSISWDNLAQTIKDYSEQISNLELTLSESYQAPQDNSTIVTLEQNLNEEVIVLLSSLLVLIDSITNKIDSKTKSTLSGLFTDFMFEFVSLNTPLVGATMKVLSNLVPQEESQRVLFWNKLDTIIFRRSPVNLTDKSYRDAFTSIFKNFLDVSGFLHLFSKLVFISSKSENGYMIFNKLAYPTNLGSGYRRTGIWPYFDYIFKEVFVQTVHIIDVLERKSIILPILQIIESSLYSFDYSVILNSVSVNVNLDNLICTNDFFLYVQESCATVVMNYLFDEEIFNVLFGIASVGVDVLANEIESGSDQLELVQLSISIINHMLLHESTYIEELYPIVKKHHKDSQIFIPKDFGLHGLRSYYDAILYNLQFVAHCALYIGLNDYQLASLSLKFLKKLSSRLSSGDSHLIFKNKLLTIFDSIDESARIKQSFINQLECTIIDENILSLKLDILDFLNSNLSYTNKLPTVAHFLLGFQVTNNISLGPNLSTFITSETSLLKSIVQLLVSSLAVLTHHNIYYAPMRLISSFMEIILKLCRNPSISSMVLDFLVSQDLFNKLLELDPKVDSHTLWEGLCFQGNFDFLDSEFTQSASIGALLSFLNYRSYLLQYLSLDIHMLSISSHKSRISSSIISLISSEVHSPIIFSFLDVLTYNVLAPHNHILKNLKVFGGIYFNLDNIRKTKKSTGNIYDFQKIDSLLNLKIRSQSVNSYSTSLLEIANKESNNIKRYITNYLAYGDFSKLQLSVLHSWVQLVQVLVIDGGLLPVTRSNFILEIFETIIPKINDYVDFDILYSEELVSLSVFLYDLFQKDRKSIDNEKTIDNRLHLLFKACIHGIKSPLSTLSLRSDFYVLSNNYLVRILKDQSLAKETLQFLKMSSERLIEVICNDTINGEGSNRITGILMLDALTQLGFSNKSNFVIDSLLKNNMLSLIIRSINNTDELLSASNENISLDSLLYELTAFKSTIYFLIRIAESRTGSQALFQNGIFTVIESCKFLRIDPDLGLELIFDEFNFKNSRFVRVNLNLDNPLSIGSQVDGISLFEVLVPIFQLITSILISMGSSNKPIIQNVKKLLIHFRILIQGILKRDALIENDSDYKINEVTFHGLKKLVKLIVLLCTFTGYHGEQDSHNIPKIHST